MELPCPRKDTQTNCNEKRTQKLSAHIYSHNHSWRKDSTFNRHTQRTGYPYDKRKKKVEEREGEGEKGRGGE